MGLGVYTEDGGRRYLKEGTRNGVTLVCADAVGDADGDCVLVAGREMSADFESRWLCLCLPVLGHLSIAGSSHTR